VRILSIIILVFALAGCNTDAKLNESVIYSKTMYANGWYNYRILTINGRGNKTWYNIKTTENLDVGDHVALRKVDHD